MRSCISTWLASVGLVGAGPDDASPELKQLFALAVSLGEARARTRSERELHRERKRQKVEMVDSLRERAEAAVDKMELSRECATLYSDVVMLQRCLKSAWVDAKSACHRHRRIENRLNPWDSDVSSGSEDVDLDYIREVGRESLEELALRESDSNRNFSAL